jgi:peptidoglycan-associated lipoprotein
MTRIPLRTVALAAATLALAACHKAPAPAPAPQAAPVVDNSAAEARARAAAQARADSIARAEAARRDELAREDAARRAREAAAARTTLATAIYFDLDKDALRPDAEQALDAKIPVLTADPGVHIRIDGNADDRGSDAYNLALSQRRSASAQRYLEARGVDGSRIEVVSFGKERPVCKVDDESCWQQNRRDGFSITAGAGSLGSAKR